jgi:predicted exporter
MSPWTVSWLASDAPEAEAVAQRLRGLDVVGRVITPADLVPGEQEQKLEIIFDIASFLPPVRAPRSVPTLEQQRSALRRFEAAAAGFADPAGSHELDASVRRLAAAVQELGTRIEAADSPLLEIQRAEASMVEPIDWWITRLRRAVEAQPVTLDDLPIPVREQMIGRDGRLRVEVFPSRDVGEPAELARFVDGVRKVVPDVAGHALYLLEFGRSMVRSLQQALFTAVLVIGVLLYLLWRRFGDTLIVLVILGLGATLTTAVATLLGIPFNFADVIALPLLLGLGVDSSIHLVHRFRSETGLGGELLHTSTARAVTYSGLTTLASFGSLAFAPHRGMASIGQLLTIGVLLMLACNLVVLPALLRPRSGSPRPASGP